MKASTTQFVMILMLLVLTNTAKAQTQGCLIGADLYNKSTYAVIPSLGCGWQTPRATGPSGWSSFELTLCGWVGGTPGGYNPRPITSCPLDAYTAYLLVCISTMGFFCVKKKMSYAFLKH